MADFGNNAGVEYVGQRPVSGFTVAVKGESQQNTTQEWAFRDGRRLMRTNEGGFSIRNTDGTDTRFDTDKVIDSRVAGAKGQMFIAKNGASILVNERGMAFYRQNPTDIMEPLSPVVSGQGPSTPQVQDSKKVSAYSIQGKNGERYIIGLNANASNPDGSSPKVSVYKQNTETQIYQRQEISNVTQAGASGQQIKLTDGTVISDGRDSPSLNGTPVTMGPEITPRYLGVILADAERMPSRAIPAWGRSVPSASPSP